MSSKIHKAFSCLHYQSDVVITDDEMTSISKINNLIWTDIEKYISSPPEPDYDLYEFVFYKICIMLGYTRLITTIIPVDYYDEWWKLVCEKYSWKNL